MPKSKANAKNKGWHCFCKVIRVSNFIYVYIYICMNVYVYKNIYNI